MAEPLLEEARETARMIRELPGKVLNEEGEESLARLLVDVVDHAERAASVVEAARDVRENSKQAIGMVDPWGSQGPPILVAANDWFRLADAVDALTAAAQPDQGAAS